jgi:hypothetical protein
MANSETIWTRKGKFEHCLPASFRHKGRDFNTSELTVKDLEWLRSNGCTWVRIASKKNPEESETATTE